MSDPVSIKDSSNAPVDVAADQVTGYGRVQVTKLLLGGDGVDGGLVAAGTPLPVSGPLTDAQLRATALPVSGTVGVTGVATEASLATVASAVKLHNAAAADGGAGIPLLVRRRDTDVEPVVDDGDFTYANIDEEGRIKVASKPASYPDITGDITTIQATINTPVAGGTVGGDVSRASNVMAFCTGTFSGINCTFEGSLEPTGDGNWFAIQAVRSNANTIETTTGALSAQPAYAWEMSVNALARVRVRATARTSGTQSWRFKQGTYATEPIPAAQITGTQPVSGTVTANLGSGGSAATSLGKAEDAVHASGDVGVAMLAVRTDAPATTSSATGDYDVLHTCSSGGLHVSPIANARNGMTRVRVAAAASTNATSVKNSLGVVWGIRLFNNTSAKKFFKLYNKASAPTVGTDVPVETIIIPADGGMVLSDVGDEFSLGIAYAITGGIADNDTTAVAANDVHGAILYK